MKLHEGTPERLDWRPSIFGQYSNQETGKAHLVPIKMIDIQASLATSMWESVS
jgi:hypothetical protein